MRPSVGDQGVKSGKFTIFSLKLAWYSLLEMIKFVFVIFNKKLL